MSIKDQIIASKDLELAEVEIPEWDCTVYFKPPNVATGERIEAESLKQNADLTKPDRMKGFRARVLCELLCDAEGNPIFDFNKPEDLDALNKKSMKVVNRLTEKALEYFSYSEADVEELVEN